MDNASISITKNRTSYSPNYPTAYYIPTILILGIHVRNPNRIVGEEI